MNRILHLLRFALVLFFAQGFTLRAQEPVHLDHLWQPNHIALCSALDTANQVLYIGGNFSHVGPPVPHAARINTVTGEPLLAQDAPNDAVYAVTDDGAGGHFIGGLFSAVASQPAGRLARIDANGQRHPWNPALNGTVRALERSGDTLYVGGEFTMAGSVQRQRFAAFRIGTGELLPWAPSFNSSVLALHADGPRLIIAGGFSAMNGSPRNALVSVNRFSGAESFGFPQANGTVRTLMRSGNTLYLGGDFAQMGGMPRTRMAALQLPVGSVLPFDAQADGPVRAFAIANDSLYVGGDFNQINGQVRSRIGLVHAASGTLLPWSPLSDGPILSMALAGDTLFVAGQITSTGSAGRRNLAALRRSTIYAHLWRCDASEPVHCLLKQGGSLFAGGDYKTIGCAFRRNLAAIDLNTGRATDWDAQANQTVQAMVLRGDTLFIGGSFSEVNASVRLRVAALKAGAVDYVLPMNATFDVTSTVLTLDEQDGKLYMGGRFDQVNGSGRRNAAAIDRVTGALTSWFPDPSSTVENLVADGPYIYLAGNFQNVNLGLTATPCLARVQSNTGWPSDWPAIVNWPCWLDDVQVKEGTVYLGGSLYAVNGIAQSRVAAIDAATGALLPWNPMFDGSVSSIAARGDDIYVGGWFMTADGDSVNKLGAFNRATAELLEWDARIGPKEPFMAVGRVRIQGDVLVAMGGFSHAGGTDRHGLAAFRLPVQAGSPSPRTRLVTTAWPNPFNDLLHVEMDAGMSGAVRYQLLDALGRTVHSGFAAANGTLTIAGLDALPSGPYAIMLLSASGRLALRTVKQ